MNKEKKNFETKQPHKYIVYQHTNKINGKFYIGFTGRTIEERWERHVEQSQMPPEHRYYFQHAIAKYGTDSWDHKVIGEYSSERQAADAEIAFIAYYKSNNAQIGYNQTIGGEGGWRSDDPEKRKLTKKQLLEGIVGCDKIDDLIEKLQVGRKIIYHYINKFKIKEQMYVIMNREVPYHRFDHFTKEDWQTYYNEAGSVLGVAKKLKTTDGTVYRFFEKFDILMPHLDPFYIENYFTTEEILYLYNDNGKTCKGVAKILGCEVYHVVRYVNIYLNHLVNKRVEYNLIFNKDSEESFYWAGFLVALGGIRDSGFGSGFIECLAEYKDHLKKFRDLISPDKEIISLREGSKSCLCFSGKENIESLVNKFNIQKDQIKLEYVFPKNLFDNKFIKHFVRGIIDGKFRNMKRFDNITIKGGENVIKSIDQYFLNMKIIDDIKEFPTKDSNWWGVKYSGQTLANIIHHLYPPETTLYLARKIDPIKEYVEKNFSLHVNRFGLYPSIKS